MFGRMLQWLTSLAPPPAWAPSTLAVALGALLAVFPVTWRWLRYLATWVHEAGHATVALLSGRRVTSMKVAADSSGETVYWGSSGFGAFLTTLAGYPAPAVVGCVVVVLVGQGRFHVAVAALLVVVLVFLPVQRSGRALWWALLLGCSMAALVVLPQWWSQILLLGLGGFLLAATPRALAAQRRARSRGRRSGRAGAGRTDADLLAGMTRVPAVLWETAFLVAVAVLTAVAVLSLVDGLRSGR